MSIQVADSDFVEYEPFVDGAFQSSTGDDRIEVEYPYDGTV